MDRPKKFLILKNTPTISLRFGVRPVLLTSLVDFILFLPMTQKNG